jgi:hypothetical protein
MSNNIEFTYFDTGLCGKDGRIKEIKCIGALTWNEGKKQESKADLRGKKSS